MKTDKEINPFVTMTNAELGENWEAVATKRKQLEKTERLLKAEATSRMKKQDSDTLTTQSLEGGRYGFRLSIRARYGYDLDMLTESMSLDELRAMRLLTIDGKRVKDISDAEPDSPIVEELIRAKKETNAYSVVTFGKV